MEGPMRVMGEETARAESLGRDLAAQARLTDRLPNIAGKIAHLEALRTDVSHPPHRTPHLANTPHTCHPPLCQDSCRMY